MLRLNSLWRLPMLLETLDLKTNDILIYSQNLFNFSENFKIIFKNSRIKKPQRISYFDVCNYVKDPSPKNLIVYRLLTNVNNLDAYSTKYGYFIKIDGRMELVYFDPIFSIKDLRHLRFELDPNYFRFKIQQVGLTSLTRWEDEPDFSEVYSFDMKAAEAQKQNDKIFADAIFAFDPDFVDQDEDEFDKIISDSFRLKDHELLKNKRAVELSASNISEDKNVVASNMNMPAAPDILKATHIREEVVSLLKQALNIPVQSKSFDASAGEEINNSMKQNQNMNHITSDSQSEVTSLLDLFKSTNNSDRLTFKERESVILKFEKK